MAADAAKMTPKIRDTIGREIMSPDESKLVGDWKNDTITSWRIESGKTKNKNAKLTNENTNEWKHKNLYSVSARNCVVSTGWSGCRSAALANALLENEHDKTENREKGVLLRFREYLANYQESYGVPRTEYTFSALIKVMGQATGRALLALFYVIVNITPISQILLHILRFVLDKTISIQKTNDARKMLLNYAILGLQLVCVYVCLVFIFGSIVTPIMYMAVGILGKIML